VPDGVPEGLSQMIEDLSRTAGDTPKVKTRARSSKKDVEKITSEAGKSLKIHKW